jgi:integrase
MDFSDQIKAKLTEKGLSPNSIRLYVRNIEKLNGKEKMKNLNFLSNVDDITKKLAGYKGNSQRTYLISIVSVLKALKGDNKRLEKLYKTYYDKMIDIAKELKTIPTGEKSETQEKNWLSWEEVKQRHDELQKNSSNSFDDMLRFMVLSLYTMLQPRRNADYQLMNVVKQHTDKHSQDRNYLDMDAKKFIFNQYKTSKKYGSQIVDIPPELMGVITQYLKKHPIIKGKITKTTNTPFLVYDDGKPLDKINSITRILNKIFGRHIGSSMLRHIFLSGKYGDKLDEMKKDSEIMGHSVDQQRDYVKTD